MHDRRDSGQKGFRTSGMQDKFEIQVRYDA